MKFRPVRAARRFITDQTGAVTVDWVVLTAVIVGLALVIIGIIIVGLQDASSGISADVVSAATRG